MDTRLKRIHAKLEKDSLDALIVLSPYNISYLTRYRSRDSYLIITKDKNIYFTDLRYIEEAKKCLKGFVIEKISDTFPKTAGETCATRPPASGLPRKSSCAATILPDTNRLLRVKPKRCRAPKYRKYVQL